MRRLSQIVLLLALSVNLFGQSPHGDELTIACEDCHNPKGWKLEAGTYSFTHTKTGFPLEGMHQDVNCINCHPTLVFSKTENECMSCHTDMHAQTVGMECARCHTPKSWIVENISDIHQQSRFPLVGSHFTADCYDCHPSASLLQFQPLGIECYDCHQQDYATTTQPNHIEGNFSTDCYECHSINAFTWSGTGFNHAIFPLTAGHAINDCNECHTGNDYSDISSDCYSCHQPDYTATNNPNHFAADINTDCAECHTTNPDWKPAQFAQHDAQYFPVYSGKHGGEWNSCVECHESPSNFASFTCISCHDHNQGEMDDEHEGIGGYAYNSIACLECHPTGDAEGSFNHSATNFPLTGAHVDTECKECHPEFYPGTSTVCFDCHTQDFNQTTNPNHTVANIQNACEECHSTAPGWIPASFDNHNEYYALTGAHTAPEVDCFACHEGNYTATPNECAGCHTENYNQTTNPNHNEIGIAFACEECHTTDPGWTPAGFEVHNEFYPLTGAHLTMPSCFDCHEGNYTNTPNECASCHTNAYEQTTNPNHTELAIAMTCEECHTTNPGWTPALFEVHNEYYPLTGAHVSVPSCFDCHEGSYTNTPNECYGCHADDYNQTNDPPHQSAQFPIDCEQCHTTSVWDPSTFNHDGQYFPIYSGAHNEEWNQCSDCHENPTNYAIFTCITCHEQGDMNEEHQGISGYQYNSIACLSCHPDGSSSGAFNHSSTNFPLTGAHTTVDCNDCHENGYAGTSTICADCHQDNFNQTTNPNHSEVGISNECAECHTTDPGWTPATFEVHSEYYPLTGAHLSMANCFDCHEGNYTNTPNECAGCHTSNYNQTTNPNHNEVGISTDCAECHSTDPGWTPAEFAVHNEYYPLTGAHASIPSCFDCHEGNYSNTPNECYGCHADDYNQTNDPPHQSAQFPIDCESCHTTSVWDPSTFNHDSQYFPIYSGTHNEEWNQCSDCHENPSNYAIFTCITCHEQGEMNDKHNEVTGYQYNSIACLSCHPNGNNSNRMIKKF